MDKCIACGVCAEKCPRKADDAFNQGLDKRKAAYVLYPQAVPLKYVIDKERCIYFEPDKKGKLGRCRACEKFCPAEAVDFDQQDTLHRLEVASEILTAGYQPFDPARILTYQYGKLPNVVTSLEFERILSASGPFEGHLVRPSDKTEPQKIAWLQYAGSRDVKHHSYCSSVCCMYAIKEAVIAKEHAGNGLDCAIFFMDMRTFGKDFELYYNRAREEQGVRFIRSRIHTIDPAENDDLCIAYLDEAGEKREEVFNMAVLSVGMEIGEDVKKLAESLGVDLTQHLFTATHPFTPVATSLPGVYVCGAMQSPKDIGDAIEGEIA